MLLGEVRESHEVSVVKVGRYRLFSECERKEMETWLVRVCVVKFGCRGVYTKSGRIVT